MKKYFYILFNRNKGGIYGIEIFNFIYIYFLSIFYLISLFLNLFFCYCYNFIKNLYKYF